MRRPIEPEPMQVTLGDYDVLDPVTPSFCQTAQSTASVLAFHLFDFLRIYTTILFLCGQYADQVTLQLARCGKEPSPKPQDSWKTSLSMMVGSAVVAIIAKLGNAHYLEKDGIYKAFQDYVYAIFSSSIFFTLLALLSSSGYLPTMSQIAFILISLTGVLLAMAIFLKLVTPISNNKIISIDASAKAFPNPSRIERILNAAGSVGHVASLSTFFWVLNNELNNGPAPLTSWQKISLGIGGVGSALIGAKTITDHPKFYLYFLMAVIFLNSSAMAYSGYSSLFGPNNAPNQKLLISLGALFSIMVGSFSGLMFQHNPDEKHESNLAIEKIIENSHNKISALFQRRRTCGEVVSEEPDCELQEIRPR